ncbi:hypothetical protein P7C71_g6564, partial [Lecanoromycetidae sp. Uapishka_2]
MPFGKLYNLFDAKWVYIGSFVLFQASSALCGGAPNMTAEIIGRVFAGAGGNGMYLGLLTLISVNTTDEERPAWLSLSTMVLANGFFMAKWGRYTPWYLIGSIITLIGSVLMSKIHVHTSASAIYGYEVLIAFGAGSFVQASFAVIQTIVVPAEMSYGITMMLIAQLSGLTLGLSIAGAVFENLAQNGLAVLLTGISREEVQQLVSGTSSALFASLPADTRAQALDIIVQSLRTTFIGGYAAAAAAFVCALLMNHKKSMLPQGTAG